MNARNKQLAAGAPLFEKVDAGNTFSVLRQMPGGSVARVQFTLKGSVIAVEGSDVTAFNGTLTLNDEAQCRLRVSVKEGEIELDEWQVLRRALESLLFG